MDPKPPAGGESNFRWSLAVELDRLGMVPEKAFGPERRRFMIPVLFLLELMQAHLYSTFYVLWCYCSDAVKTSQKERRRSHKPSRLSFDVHGGSRFQQQIPKLTPL
jgi:hypothetical protein